MWEGSAGLYEQNKPEQRVHICVSPQQLQISSLHSPLNSSGQTFFSSEFKITKGPTTDQYRINLPSHQSFLIVTDPSFIPYLKKNNRSALPIHVRLPLPLILALMCLLVVGCTLSSFKAVVPKVEDWVADKVPPDLEKKLGDILIKQIPIDTQLSEEQINVLKKCEKLLNTYPKKKDIPYQLYLVEDTSVINAFAMPGGHIVFYTGILKFMENQDEFMAVLFHEAGHIYHRHSVQQVIRTASFSLLLAVIMGETTGLTGLVLQNSEMLLNRHYSREAERESDEFALEMLSHYQVDVKGMMDFFERLEKKESNTAVAKLISTHPTSQSRKENAKKALEQQKTTVDLLTQKEWEILKNIQKTPEKKQIAQREF